MNVHIYMDGIHILRIWTNIFASIINYIFAHGWVISISMFAIPATAAAHPNRQIVTPNPSSADVSKSSAPPPPARAVADQSSRRHAIAGTRHSVISLDFTRSTRRCSVLSSRCRCSIGIAMGWGGDGREGKGTDLPIPISDILNMSLSPPRLRQNYMMEFSSPLRIITGDPRRSSISE